MNVHHHVQYTCVDLPVVEHDGPSILEEHVLVRNEVGINDVDDWPRTIVSPLEIDQIHGLQQEYTRG